MMNKFTRKVAFPNVVPYTICKSIVHILPFLTLMEVANSGHLGKYFNNVSCQLDSTLQQQNVTIDQIFTPNSTVELRKKCENIDLSCTCDSPQKMRCHNPAIENLNNIIMNITESVELDIKMLDWNLPGMEVFRKNVFRNSNEPDNNSLHLLGLFISSNGTLRRLEDGSFLGLRKELQILGLSDNNFGPEIPKEIFSLPHLVQLDVSKNNISYLRPILNYTTRSLKYLDLSNNNLESINDLPTNLFPESLCTLKVTHNKLTLEGLTGANFVKIGLLDLSNNNISGNLTRDIFDGGGGKQIEILYLDYNQLRYVGENSFCGLPMLKNLWLSHNNIDRLDKESFRCLDHLSYIDLSHNQILDITRGLFEPTANTLTKLILSHNHLSVLYSPLTAVSLSRLTYIDLQNNEIIKIEGRSLQSLPNLKTLLLSGNKLDCSCQLRDFQRWIIGNSTQLNEQSRSSAKCETPRLKSNAALADLPLIACTENNNGSSDRSFLPFEEERNYRNNPAVVDPKELRFVNSSFNNVTRLLHMSWSSSINMSYYGCDQVQVQCVPTIKDGEMSVRNNPKEVYSKPLECNNLTNNTLINVTIDTTKFSPCNPSEASYNSEDLSYFICLIVKNVTLKNKLNSNNPGIDDTSEEYPDNVVPGCVSMSLPGPFSNLSALFDVHTRSLTVIFVDYIENMYQEEIKCKTHVQVFDRGDADSGDDLSVVDKRRVDCTENNFTFYKMQYGGKKGDSLSVCVWKEIDHVQTSEKQCAHAMQTRRSKQNNNMSNENLKSSDKRDTKMPLILTLVFLCVGIIGLVILYNVVKGYLSDRRGTSFVPSFLCFVHQWRNRSWRNCGGRRNHYSYKTAHVFAFQQEASGSHVTDRENSSWLSRMWSWMSRKIRYRGHHHTVNTDEAALEDEFCTEMSFVN